ncbi:endonuclease 8-like 1 [Penaeus vannamei]|uniref:endonuclease 8-like 1 n=1 Tax=Penaeus vannamei TaxID=6689 RepID=UPI00387F6BFA
MPEGPEIYLASRFINLVSKSRIYGGQVVKSEVSTKNPDVPWAAKHYRVTATARGKELKVTVHEGRDEEKKNRSTLDILIRFGMSGSFKFTQVDETPKHAHLRFYTVEEDPPMVLSFVDYRRFGRWEVNGTWGSDRGPDPMWEYPGFRENILTNLKSAAFNKPICEAMLNQKFFNGIGNYLRAEILYRCGIAPFDEAREVLSEIKPFSKWYESTLSPKTAAGVKCEPDILDLCHILPKEVINLEGKGKGYNVDLDADEDDYKAFKEWLQCYYQDGMNNMVDHNGRTMWFSGKPGKMVPKAAASRGKKQSKKNKKDVDEEDTANHGSSRKRVKKEAEDEIKKEDMKQLKQELKEDMKKQVKKEIKKEVKEKVKKEVKEEQKQGRARKNSKKSANIKENNAVKTSITISNKLAQKIKENKPKRANNREKKPVKNARTPNVKNARTPKVKVTKKIKVVDSVHRESPVRRSKRLGSVIEN